MNGNVRAVKAELVDGGEYVHIKLKGASRGYQWVFFAANDLPQLADMSEEI